MPLPDLSALALVPPTGYYPFEKRAKELDEDNRTSNRDDDGGRRLQELIENFPNAYGDARPLFRKDGGVTSLDEVCKWFKEHKEYALERERKHWEAHGVVEHGTYVGTRAIVGDDEARAIIAAHPLPPYVPGSDPRIHSDAQLRELSNDALVQQLRTHAPDVIARLLNLRSSIPGMSHKVPDPRHDGLYVRTHGETYRVDEPPAEKVEEERTLNRFTGGKIQPQEDTASFYVVSSLDGIPGAERVYSVAKADPRPILPGEITRADFDEWMQPYYWKQKFASNTLEPLSNPFMMIGDLADVIRRGRPSLDKGPIVSPEPSAAKQVRDTIVGRLDAALMDASQPLPGTLFLVPVEHVVGAAWMLRCNRVSITCDAVFIVQEAKNDPRKRFTDALAELTKKSKDGLRQITGFNGPFDGQI